MGVLLRHRHGKESVRNARLKRELALEDDHVRCTGVTPAGDERRLRGIPVQTRGVGGAIAGTRP